MYKVHRPHLKSGYLKKVSCDAVRDSDGNPDWMFYYTPGPKAVREFKTFNKNHVLSDTALETAIDVETSVPASTTSGTTDAQAREIVADFYRRFHNTKNSLPQAKEIAQARTLIDTHGIEKAQHIVQFSHQNAPDSKYRPQTFGGILQYTGRAIADYESRQRNQQTTAATAQCSLCNKAAMVSMKSPKNQYVSVKCSHDIEQMKAYAESKGYEIV